MKLQKLYEEQLTHEQIQEIVKRYTTGNFTINANGSIDSKSLLIDKKSFYDLAHLVQLNFIDTLKLFYVSLDDESVTMLPVKSNYIDFNHCSLPDDLRLIINILDEIRINRSKMKSFYYESTQKAKISIKITDTFESLQKITISNKNDFEIETLKLEGVFLNSFDNINIVSPIDEFIFSGAKTISDFKGLEKMNIRNMQFGCRNILSFKGMENVSVKNLIIYELNNVSSYNNIICLLVSNCENVKMLINIYEDKNVSILDKILKPYFKLSLQDRHASVMDCALELIDAGYEEAAEL